MAVGKNLKEKRKELGLTIEEAEEQTKIRKKYLRALEEDEYNEIPGLVYAKAFLKTYSSYLGLDQEEILEEFERWRHLEDVDTELEGKRRKRRSRQDSGRGISDLIASFLSFSPRTLLVIFIIFLVAGGVAYNFVIMNDAAPETQPGPEEEIAVEDERLEDEETEEAEEFADEPEFAEEDEDIDSPEETALETPEFTEDEDEALVDENEIDDETPEDEAETEEDEDEVIEAEEEDYDLFMLEVSDTSWIRIIVDGENVYEGVVEDGFAEQYNPEGYLNIRTGNAGGVEISVEGGEFEAMGETGEVVETEFEF